MLKVHGIYEIMAKKGIAPRKQVYATSLQYIVKGLENLRKIPFSSSFLIFLIIVVTFLSVANRSYAPCPLVFLFKNSHVMISFLVIISLMSKVFFFFMYYTVCRKPAECM